MKLEASHAGFLKIPARLSGLLFLAGFALPVFLAVSAARAQTAQFRALEDHVPSWANDANFVEAVPASQRVSGLELVLARSAERQQAFEKLLADQQNPASPEFHHWLTSQEIGARFGLADEQIELIRGWLESEGLQVDWVSPAKNFIGFSGAAGDVGRVLQTNLNYYRVNGVRKRSISSAPILPADIASAVKSIHGLYEIDEKPMVHARLVSGARPLVTGSNGSQLEYFVGPADFARIYDVPASLNGSGITVGIVGEARTDSADFTYFQQATATSFADPTEIVPTAYDGVDPGPPYTTQQAQSVDIGDQLEATLDVLRVSTIAPKAKVLLVVATAASGGIGDGLDYLINSTPVPAKVINVSFGACESGVSPGDVSGVDSLFSQAAMEGISVFVAAGDSGASGCDTAFTTPPATPQANSPNYLCSSSYVTCLGGTEFNDTANPSDYWNPGNGAGLESALQYIPEGGWNEPKDSSGNVQVAASGGGVSQYISTPSWQTGKGVPSARTGRYTPDIAFDAAGHDGYFGCMAAAGGSCTSGGNPFVDFFGTSAAAPDMAGITALLDQKLGGKGQGNLNPEIYSLAAAAPSIFHDVTVATSGVSGCTVKTASMCNNSAPGPSGASGGQAGYLVGTGYDEVTGLGSLDVARFIDAFSAPASAPTAKTGAASAVTGASATLAGTVNPDGASTKYWFAYGTSSSLAGAATTASKSVSGTSAVSVTANLTGLKPLTKYYFQLQDSNSVGAANGGIASFTTGKEAQTISFTLPTSAKYGAAAIPLSAKASSGLAVTLKIISGPGKLKSGSLVIAGAGTIEVEAGQAGSATYAAVTLTRSIAVAKAVLTVAANDESMTAGAPVPALHFHMSGFVNGDTRGTATKSAPLLTTTATSSSPKGSYPITISAGTGPKALTAVNYSFKFVNGTMTVNK